MDKQSMIKPNLSAQILDYYEKYGKNRDLEKYLRLRENHEKTNRRSEAKPKSSPTNVEDNMSLLRAEDLAGLQNNKGHQNFLPESTTENESSFAETSSNILAKPQTKGLNSDFYKNDIVENKNMFTDTDTKLSAVNVHNKMSSRPLEWDSLGDVGYTTAVSHNSFDKNQLSVLERNVLSNFFAQRGIKINFENKNEMDSYQSEKQNNEKWRETLKKVKQKYVTGNSSKGNSSSEYTCTKFNAYTESHSTPKSQINSNTNSCSNVTLPKNADLQVPSHTGTCYRQHGTKPKENDNELLSCNSFEYIANSNTQTGDTEIYNTANNLELGVKLLCTLLENKGLNHREKTILMKKIIQKIYKQECQSNDSAQNCSQDEAADSEEKKTDDTYPNRFDCNHSTTESDKSLKTTVRSRCKRCCIPKSREYEKLSVDGNRGGKEQQVNNNFGRISKCEGIIEDDDKEKREILPERISDEIILGAKNIAPDTFGKNVESPKEKRKIFLDTKIQDWLEPMTSSEFKYMGKLQNMDSNEMTHDKNHINDFLEKEKNIHLVWIENEIDHLRNLQKLLHSLNETQKLVNIPSNPQRITRDNQIDYRNLKSSSVSSHPETSNNKHKESYCNKKQYFVPVNDNRTDLNGKIRSKLETPSSEGQESIKSFARNRKERFIKNYRTSKEHLNKQLDGDHYSEAHEENIGKGLSSNHIGESSSTDIFVSSRSFSMVYASKNTSSFTRREHNAMKGIGTQTSNSLMRTKPIYGKSVFCNCNNPFACFCHKTVRFYPKSDKETQVKPKSEAYVITFYNATRENENGSLESLGIQQVLCKNYPEFTKRAEQRRRTLKNKHENRLTRQRRINKLMLNTSINSIPKKLEQVAPPITTYTKVFAPQEVRAITGRKYRKLPEVIEKAEREKAEKIRQSNKVLTDIFNKKIQTLVHKGKLSLPII